MKPFPKISSHVNCADDVIEYKLIKTNRRLTFDIIHMHDEIIYKGDDDGDYYKFIASNGYEVISRSRMDIQTERLWLVGAKPNERSGTMVFSTNEQRDKAKKEFELAISELVDFVTDSQKMFEFGHDYWFTQYRRRYSTYIAEAVREGRKFCVYNSLKYNTNP